jgi:hypothetical protein
MLSWLKIRNTLQITKTNRRFRSINFLILCKQVSGIDNDNKNVVGHRKVRYELQTYVYETEF